MGAASAALVFPLLPGPQATAGQPGGGTLENRFTEAAERYDVPREVLMGVAYLQSRWDTHEGAPSVSGGYGPMHLTDARTALNRSAGHHHPDGDDDARGDTRRPAQRTASAGRPADGKR
ncbi:N-acetylmuramoyl-L-alanine amidase, partial [Streptomyces cacaoi]|nr:N-acetylmuramoyl-L-alanine amidase [Streptomyces cacaoi]